MLNVARKPHHEPLAGWLAFNSKAKPHPLLSCLSTAKVLRSLKKQLAASCPGPGVDKSQTCLTLFSQNSVVRVHLTLMFKTIAGSGGAGEGRREQAHCSGTPTFHTQHFMHSHLCFASQPRHPLEASSKSSGLWRKYREHSALHTNIWAPTPYVALNWATMRTR